MELEVTLPTQGNRPFPAGAGQKAPSMARSLHSHI